MTWNGKTKKCEDAENGKTLEAGGSEMREH